MQQDMLSEFIEASKTKGASDEFLAALLTRRGWPQEDVYQSLGAYWSRATGMPVPERARGGESSRDAFLYLLAFSTLATWSSALGSMLFAFIDQWFPDPVAGIHRFDTRAHVTWQMASLAVAFPIFIWVMRAILREAAANAQRLESGVRKWLTYIALLLTSGGVICDLIWFLDYFLQGELSTRFVLKAVAVLMICGGIFVYYLGSLRWDRNTDVRLARRRSLKFGIATSVILVGCFCLGLGVAGTPSAQRRLEADKRRIEDLRGIAFAAHAWQARHKREQKPPQLPNSLSDLVGNGVTTNQIVDPETKVRYRYKVNSDTRYQLCANFNSEAESELGGNYFWEHGKGQTCFTLDASEVPAWQ